MCRSLAGTLASKDNLIRLYERSEGTGKETSAAICRSKGSYFIVPYREEAGSQGRIVKILGREVELPAWGP